MLEKPMKGPYIVGFNGPPRSGKDTLATHLMNLLDEFQQSTPVHRHALAATMRDGAAAILGMTGGDKWYAEIKDQPLEVLGGVTFRRFMIDMSEVFVKKIYGRDFWSRLLYDRNKHWWHGVPSILIVTDIGFNEEVEFFCDHSEAYLNIRLDRPGTSFEGDSRGYVHAGDAGGIDWVLTNNETPEEGAKTILERLYKLGWPVI